MDLCFSIRLSYLYWQGFCKVFPWTFVSICAYSQQAACQKLKKMTSLAKLPSHVCCAIVQYLSNHVKLQYCFRSSTEVISLGTGILGAKPCLALVPPGHLSKSTSSVLNLGFSTPERWAKPIPGPTLCFHRVDEKHAWTWDWDPTPRFADIVDAHLVFSGCWKTIGVPVALTLELHSLGF